MRITLAFMVGVVAMVVVIDPAGASTGGRQVAVSSTFTDPGSLTELRQVDCGINQPGLCEMRITGHSRLTGSASGYTDYVDWAHGNQDLTMTYYGEETFTGTIDSCGTGTFRFLSGGTIESSPDANDPLGRDFHAPWTIINGSGTGDLTSISGGGHIDGVMYPDTSTHGTFTGQVTCR